MSEESNRPKLSIRTFAELERQMRIDARPRWKYVDRDELAERVADIKAFRKRRH